MVPRRRILSRSRSPQRVPREPEEPRRYRKEEFMQMLNNNKCMIVVGEHGSRTTTEIPKWCHEWTQKHPRNTDRYPGMVACTQLNGHDAIAAAAKTADEVIASLGEEVGYAVRFERRSSNKTTLKFSTDDVLLREIMNNRSLEGYDVIIVDKVEERSLNTDILMALVKGIIKNRLDIKLVIISTKSEAGKFQNYFENCPVISVAMKEQTPQINRINLANTVLQLKKMGVEDLATFDFLDRPTPEMLAEAIESLKELAAIDDDGALIELGAKMAEFPLDVTYSKMLISSVELNCSSEILSIIAMRLAGDYLRDQTTLRQKRTEPTTICILMITNS